MGKYPIPDDWQGDEWLCVQIQWPNSVIWRAILRGVLYGMSRGRTWNEQTGRITDVQAIGREIFERNYPFVGCADTDQLPNEGSECVDFAIAQSLFGGCDDGCEGDCLDECEDNEMGCCITELRWQNGVLQYLRCGEWKDVPGGGPTTLPTGDEWEDEPTEGQETEAQYACSKAAAAVNLYYDTIEAVLQHWDTVLPWQYISRVENQVGYNLADGWLIVAQGQMLISQFLEDEMSDAIQDTPRQELICRYRDRFDGTTSRFTDEDWDAFKNVWREISSGISEPNLLFQLLQAVGQDNIDKASRQTAHVVQDCGCPVEVPPVPPDADWVHTYDFATGLHGWTIGAENQGVVWQEGLGVVQPTMAYQLHTPYVERNQADQVNGTVLTYVFVEVEWPTCDEYNDDILIQQWANVITWGAQEGNEGMWSNTPINITGSQNWTVFKGWAVDEATAGRSVLKRLIIAGNGVDPFPSDPT